MIAVVDYCKGNLRSVQRGLVAAGGNAVITDDPLVIATADAIVLPGVGSFADASTTMDALGQTKVIRDRVAAGVPFLGICLGLHLMFEEGAEGTDFDDDEADNASGLSILPGVVLPMPRSNEQGESFKVPHVGWNSLEFDPSSEARHSPLLRGISPGEHFYFTHSFIAPETSCTLAASTHSVTFPSVVSYGSRAFGVQFHPEKSSDAGAILLKNFLDIAKGC